ncbi:hypothetical protein K0J45_00025 [Shewanella alkalitolerans]|uniref:hypothetical protein n=1 Tax=Shewanella alkalitolerans TaxID=2864209 RepID=UPI001C65E71F|nr:hypothetical protein [Shewanella alkalitolerans]QYJ97691.1 hypothetical protein K0J45_00025 [Shewanella alkalitolerans]
MKKAYLAVLSILLLALGFGLFLGDTDKGVTREQGAMQEQVKHLKAQDEADIKVAIADIQPSSGKDSEISPSNSQPDADLASADQQNSSTRSTSLSSYRVTPSQAEYASLMELYLADEGPFMREGTAYFYVANQQEPYFLASPPELNDLMANDTDQYIELKVEEFNQIDEAYGDNWGGDFTELVVNYHYCKQSRCLLRASHESVTFLRDYVARYEQSHPELEVDSMTTAGGDLLLIYRRR